MGVFLSNLFGQLMIIMGKIGKNRVLFTCTARVAYIQPTLEGVKIK